jgi:hypothetical protein
MTTVSSQTLARNTSLTASPAGYTGYRRLTREHESLPASSVSHSLWASTGT